jgi:hypothetical protein
MRRQQYGLAIWVCIRHPDRMALGVALAADTDRRRRASPSKPYSSNANTRFQSFFMRMTNQPQGRRARSVG